DGLRDDAALSADPAAAHCAADVSQPQMTVLGNGVSYGVATLFAMFSRLATAFALGPVAVVFMGIYMPGGSLDTVTQNVYEEMASITLLSIPLFILKGAAIGKSRAGQDLYSALHAWLHRVPGGLGVANVFACALFAAMAGSSPATCSAIGSAGIPEMRQRGYFRRLAGRRHPRRWHARHSAAAFDHHDPVCGRLGKIARTAVSRRHRARPAAGDIVWYLCGDALPQGVRRGERGLRQDRCGTGDPGPRRIHHGRALQLIAAGSAVRAVVDRCDDRALRRLCHAVGN